MSEFTASEAAAIQNIQGAVSSNLAAILSRVINEVRENIRAGGKPVDPNSSTTIPSGLFSDAVAVARFRLVISVPQFAMMKTDSRKDEYDRAMKKLDNIALGKYGVEDPTGTVGASRGGMVDTVQDGNSGNAREDLERL